MFCPSGNPIKVTMFCPSGNPIKVTMFCPSRNTGYEHFHFKLCSSIFTAFGFHLNEHAQADINWLRSLLLLQVYQRIQQQAAFIEFSRKNFDDALDLFKSGTVDVKEVNTVVNFFQYINAANGFINLQK